MGCDIHLWIEKRDLEGRWQPAEAYNEDNYYQSDLYDTRSYKLFSLLADVRNDGSIKPIVEPRELPDDMSPIVAELARHFADHSHSWLTLRELLDYDWLTPVLTTTQVTMTEFVRWTNYGRELGRWPEHCFMSRSGPGVSTITMAEADRRLLEHPDVYGERQAWAARPEQERINVEVWWDAPIARVVDSTFFCETVPALIKIAGGSAEADQVRIVFGFDS
jgi:hypothetical protein